MSTETEIAIKKYPDDFKILRFLDKDGLMRTLGMNHQGLPRQNIDLTPTILLRSLGYYRMLEIDDLTKAKMQTSNINKDNKGDRHEGEIIRIDPESGQMLTSSNGNPTLISCWSSYQENDLQNDDVWGAFPDSVAAIESTVGEIKKIIETLAPESHLSHQGHLYSTISKARILAISIYQITCFRTYTEI